MNFVLDKVENIITTCADANCTLLDIAKIAAYLMIYISDNLAIENGTLRADELQTTKQKVAIIVDTINESGCRFIMEN